jgi:phosphoenolpyruvate carboxykinase (GTP)
MTNSKRQSPTEELKRPVTVETPVATRNAKLLDWVEEVAALTEPDAVHWCDGSA